MAGLWRSFWALSWWAKGAIVGGWGLAGILAVVAVIALAGGDDNRAGERSLVVPSATPRTGLATPTAEVLGAEVQPSPTLAPTPLRQATATTAPPRATVPPPPQPTAPPSPTSAPSPEPTATAPPSVELRLTAEEAIWLVYLEVESCCGIYAMALFTIDLESCTASWRTLLGTLIPPGPIYWNVTCKRIYDNPEPLFARKYNFACVSDETGEVFHTICY